jgi:hypothetical protein
VAASVPDSSTLLYALIVACEVAFWLVLLLALVTRYLLRRERASRWLIWSLPAIDVLLLAFTALDLRAGAAPTFAHGLAAAYVGFTVAFGSLAVRWADRHFAHRFAGGPPPPGSPAIRWLAVRFELGLWLRSIVAWFVTLALLGGLIAVLDNEAVTETLGRWDRIAFVSVVLWFVFGPLWSLLFFRRQAK